MKLSDVCTKATSNIAQKDLDARNGAYPIYGASGFIKNVDFYHQDKPYIAIVKDGAGVGRVMQLPAKSSVIGTMQYIIPNEGVSVEYLAYALEHMNLSKYYLGAAIPHIYFKDYCNESLPNHTQEEQEQISRTLGMITNLISLRKQQLSKLDELVKSRFIEMFGTLSSHEQNFEILTIEALCSLIKDGTHQTPTYTEDTINGFKFLSSKDVMTEKIDWSDIKYIPSDLHERLYAVVKPIRNDILMSKNGVNYGVAAVNDTDEVFDIYVSLALLRPKTDIINPVYFRCAINNPDTKRQFDGSIKGIGVPNLHLGEIKKTQILVPPMDKQIEYVSFVEQIDKSKFEIQQSLKKLETLKKALMQKYFG